MARDGASTPYLMSDSAKGCPVTAYPFSMSVWFYKPASHSSMCIASVGATGSTQINGIYITSGGLAQMYIGGGLAVSSSIGLSTGWSNIVAIEVGATNHKIVVNGVSNSSTVSLALTTSLDRWGALAFVSSSPGFTGASGQPVADLGVWNVALTSTEATDMYNGRLSPLMIRPQNLVAYCPLNDGDGDARDIIGGRHLIETDGSVALVDNPPLRYLRRSFSGFTPGVVIPQLPRLRSVFRGFSF